MNELQLSNDLITIETEIKSYQNVAGQSIFEIGRRLKHVKENDLAHGEFGKWLEKVNLNQRVAQQMIKIYDTPELKTRMSSNLGMQALYEIATLPEPERTKEHVTSSGETKTPDEMTVRELRELKKQIKEKEEQSKSLYKQINIANRKIEELENAEPEVIERYMEPDDYQSVKNMNEHLESEREYYKNLADAFRNEIKGLMNQSNNEVTFTKEEENEDYTPILLKILEPSEVFIQNYKHHLNKQEITNKLEKIITNLKEQ
ncbi:DUF3102 domain-containing protein [Staphylococcus chromogenes]|uniref:DUF3102 domain-containing protein n=1 Tax=Staphylococcus chromogenes TaxID=46126 RepID=UPI001C3C82E0|nr:DUF3102 domain-containing protein [Staphylococcus chromogenes]MBV5190956.1 DUF3102 domain-containing protein [Staphylococcus chromogenes]MBW3131803.1 DUF3102 domain-containing protein [Staphylococcus chromogenes]